MATAGVIAAQAATPVDIPFVSRHIELIVVVIAVASAVPVIASAAAAFVRRRQAVEGR